LIVYVIVNLNLDVMDCAANEFTLLCIISLYRQFNCLLISSLAKNCSLHHFWQEANLPKLLPKYLRYDSFNTIILHYSTQNFKQRYISSFYVI